MGATKRLVIISLAIVLGGITAACASNEPVDYQAFSEHQKVLEQCLDNLDSSVRQSLGAPPQFVDIKQAVRWTRAHLPSDIRAAFNRAGQLAITAAQPNGLPALATNKAKLNKLLYHATAKVLGSLAQYQQEGCDIVVPQKLSNILDLTLNLSRGTMKKRFDALGLNDSYSIESAYLLMLTLDASGNKWDVTWFSKP
ncbi:MAG: hypothetical protein ACRESI_01530 [Gammaproteobacteria bacterium]